MKRGGPKFIFDENIGKPLVQQIERLLECAEKDEKAEVQHVLDFQKSLGIDNGGVWDNVWIPQLADAGWTVITADRGRRGRRRGEKLPRLCVQFGIVHVLLSARVQQRKSFQRLLTILSVWHELIDIAQSAPPGARYVLEPTTMKPTARGRGRLALRDTTPGPPRPPKGMLF